MERKTIMLVYSAGMGMSFLITKMQKTAEAKGMEADIFAVSTSDADNQLESKNIDVSLLGPQVRFTQNQFAEKPTPKGVPLDIINMANYGTMNGEKVFGQVKKLINKQ